MNEKERAEKMAKSDRYSGSSMKNILGTVFLGKLMGGDSGRKSSGKTAVDWQNQLHYSQEMEKMRHEHRKDMETHKAGLRAAAKPAAKKPATKKPAAKKPVAKKPTVKAATKTTSKTSKQNPGMSYGSSMKSGKQQSGIGYDLNNPV